MYTYAHIYGGKMENIHITEIKQSAKKKILH